MSSHVRRALLAAFPLPFAHQAQYRHHRPASTLRLLSGSQASTLAAGGTPAGVSSFTIAEGTTSTTGSHTILVTVTITN